MDPKKEKRDDEDEEELPGEVDAEDDFDRFPEIPRRRRAFDPFSIGWDMDDEFEQMRRYMDSMMKAAMRGSMMGGPGKDEPFVYGFTLRVGPDGKPHIQEFGNTNKVRRLAPPAASKAGSSTKGRSWAAEEEDEETEGPVGREPLTDVIDCGETIGVTVELPGVDKDDIKLEITDTRMTISVNTESRRYFKEVELPAPVKEDTAKASYKNGILDITLQKKAPPKKKGVKIEVD